MESMSIDPAAALVGAQLVESATRAVGAGAAASPTLTALVPGGADPVSAHAATAFATEGASMLALTTAAQEEIARAGTALTNITRIYTEVDGAAATTLADGGAQVASNVFTSPTGVGAGLLRGETLPGSSGTAARTPQMANLLGGVAASNPATAMPAASPVASVPAAAAGAVSTVAGAVASPLSSLGSLGGASAGGATGPALASSLTQNEGEEKSESDESGEQKPGEQLL